MSSENKQCCCSRGRDGSCCHKKGLCASNDAGSGGGCCSSGCQDRVLYITENEKAFMTKLSEIPFLPLARFVIRSSKDDDAVSVALAPVYLNGQDDSPDTVKKNREILQSLEDKYLITLDYDLPLQNGDYAVYKQSGVYREFCESIGSGVNEDGTIYDLPVLQRGSFALTSLGQEALEDIE